jgi:outer membrane protein TolC
MSRTHTRGVTIAAIGALVVLFVRSPRPLGAQQDTTRQTATSARRLSLEDALKAAEGQSAAVQIARAGLTRAEGQRYQARSQYMPQVSAVAIYQRTLNSQFQGISFGGPADTSSTPRPQAVCAPSIPAGATPAQVQAALAQASTCQAAAGGFNFQSVGFGAPNQYTAGLNFSQNIYTGGRISGQYQAARAGSNSAVIEVAAQKAQLALDVTQAYYDAALADKLVSIQESALAQTEEILRQTRVAKQVGNQAEFDLLRAQVTRDNQVPVVLQARNSREVAYYRLKQLLNLPMDGAVALSTPLDDSTATSTTVLAAVKAGSSRAISPASATLATMVVDTNVSDRAPVRELEENVRAQQGLLKAAKGEKLPYLQITSGYQRLYFPTNLVLQLNNARINWTVGVTASMPIFDGGKIKGDEMIAQANLNQARAQLQQTREFAALDARVALSALQQAEATWQASAGTAGQAEQAYNIDQIRYREGISTQTDLSQTRILLEQALANRAQAARDLAVARVKLALLRDLPLQAAGTGTPSQSQTQSGNSVNGSSQATPNGTGTQTPTRTQTQAAASASGVSGGGITP